MRSNLMKICMYFLLALLNVTLSSSSIYSLSQDEAIRHEEISQAPTSEGKTTQLSSTQESIHEVGSTPYELNAGDLKPDFSVSLTGGLRVGSARFPYKLLVPELYRFDREGFVNALIQSGVASPVAAMVKDGADCVTKVEGPPGGPFTYKRVVAPVISEHDEPISGLSVPGTINAHVRGLSNPVLYRDAGTLRDINGVFVFGEQYVSWIVRGGADEDQNYEIRIKNCVFVTKSTTLYANNTSSILTGDCWFPIGAYEFRGEAEIFEGGIRLLPGSTYRKLNRTTERSAKLEAYISILHDVAEIGDIAAVEAFLEKGVDVNAKDQDGWTPLHGTRSKEVAELLIAKGADVNAKDDDRETPLHHAAYRGHKEIAELLVAKGADVNAKDEDDWMPLHNAVLGCSMDVVELLIAKGADINARSRGNPLRSGGRPLKIANREGHTELAALLKRHGAKK